MLFYFKNKFPQLNKYWDKYLPFQKQVELQSRAVLLEEGAIAKQYFFVKEGCLRACFNNNDEDKTVQFFFENEGLSSLESFMTNKPSAFTIETIEPSTVYALDKDHFFNLIDELSNERNFFYILMEISAARQFHYMNEFVSFIRDSPEQRYLNLLHHRPHIIKRVPLHFIASYLGVSRVHLSRIKAKLARTK
ncbi:Crp/Fnr family transcriptional regulator [Mucilaginibacter gotjawali]|uniref:Cyclic nucleotide-binding domain protein n=2 Tax=Mucilaginibacter gotjawali TaxID=1550579 RepID=A0A110AZP1_9SPHI|nr:Crp/Fnr family transcriptional regulator [Mucilaginibacter gotjawali]MBB3058047.1 CRP-like cAMP-binding protein [Mucilaginibacter gotjawali]BAU52022.1 Cyclic nucleotide-binding domain protein [Mucilaginibacter gotjawali]